MKLVFSVSEPGGEVSLHLVHVPKHLHNFFTNPVELERFKQESAGKLRKKYPLHGCVFPIGIFREVVYEDDL